MKQFLFPEGAKFYKANLHCHTSVSDGKLTPAEVKAAYKAKGYHAVAFTDHEALIGHADLCDEGFIALHGYETAIKETNGVSTMKNHALKVHHIIFIKKKQNDLTQFCFYPENFTPGNCKAQIPFLRYTGDVCTYSYAPSFVNHLIREAHQNGCLVHYNHPRWSLQSAETLKELEGVDALEVFNTISKQYGDFDDSVYEELLRYGWRCGVVGGDDNHNGTSEGKAVSFNDSFGGFTMIAAEEFSYEGLTEALARGNSYASSGPLIHSLYVEDGYLVCHTSPAARITLRSEGRWTQTIEGKNGYVDRAAFPLDADKLGSYFRLVVVDKNGDTAYTRAYDTERYL